MAVSEQVATKSVLTDDQAAAVLRAAEAKAREAGAAMVIAVVDAAGDLKAFTRMDGAPKGSIQWTTDKAFTAASFGMPTHVLTEGVQNFPPVLASMASLPHVTLTPGGYPLVLADTLIGAVAAGGGTTPDQDQVVATAGVAALQPS